MCKKECKVCSNFETCLSCEKNYFLYENKCLSECPDGFFNKNGKCEKCEQEDCLECMEERPDKCLKCNEVTLLSENKCIKVCPNGTFKKNGMCQSR